MRRLFGFLFFLIGAVALILIYLVKAGLVASNSAPYLNFAFQNRESLILSVIAFVILFFLGLLMIGRVWFGVMLLLIGLAGMIFPILTRFSVIAVPTDRTIQSLLTDNFYITVLVGLVFFAIGLFLLTMRKSKE